MSAGEILVEFEQNISGVYAKIRAKNPGEAAASGSADLGFGSSDGEGGTGSAGPFCATAADAEPVVGNAAADCNHRGRDLDPARCQRVQDLLTQMAVTVQGYLALDLVKKNNVELIKGVDRASTTTVAALRTAVTVAQALVGQKLVLDQISNALERQARVEIRGFGSFALHHRPARTGRNPKTGAPVHIPAKSVPHFKPGKEMRERVNAVAEEEAAAAAKTAA